MFRRRVWQSVIATGVLVLAQVACSIAGFTVSPDQSGTPPVSETIVVPGADVPTQSEGDVEVPPTEQKSVPPSAPIGPPTPTPFIYQGPQPASGTGGVYGRLFWNGQPVEGIQVKLCDEIKFLGGCQGAEYPAITDASGVYTILNVPPGNYGLTYRAMDADNWYFVTSGALNAKDFEVATNEMVNVGDHHTVRLDLVILTPLKNERLSSIARPTISWEPYPSAAYYELTLQSDRGSVMISKMKLTDSNYTIDRDLQTCAYSFNIEVFNEQEIMIAENSGWHGFKVAGLPQSCNLVALTPANGATVSAKDITLTWQPHDWAAVYKLHMYNTKDYKQKILNFVEANTTSYTLTQNVPSGEYVWVVYAYDQFDEMIGFSDQFTLYVTNP